MRSLSVASSSLVAALVLAVGSAHADPSAGQELITQNSGKIIITEDEPPSAAELERFVKARLKKDGQYSSVEDAKMWTVHLTSFLKKDPAGEQLTFVLYDKDNKESIKKLEPVQAFPLSSVKGQRIVAFPNLHLTEDNGFVAGKTYLVRVTTLKGTTELTLAEAQLTLKAPAAPPAPAPDEGKDK